MELEWIRIEDQLPESGEEVLASNCYDREWVVIAVRKKTQWYNSWDLINHNNKVPIYPTHWMPKPSPPEPPKQ